MNKYSIKKGSRLFPYSLLFLLFSLALVSAQVGYDSSRLPKIEANQKFGFLDLDDVLFSSYTGREGECLIIDSTGIGISSQNCTNSTGGGGGGGGTSNLTLGDLQWKNNSDYIITNDGFPEDVNLSGDLRFWKAVEAGAINIIFGFNDGTSGYLTYTTGDLLGLIGADFVGGQDIIAFNAVNSSADKFSNGSTTFAVGDVTKWAYNQTIGTSNIFDQDLNTTSNVTFHNITSTGNISADYNLYADTIFGETQVLASTDSGAGEGYGFISDADTGLFMDAGGVDPELRLVKDGTDKIVVGSMSNAIQIEDQLLIQTGSEANPAVYFTGDSDTGIYRVGANSFGISAGGDQKARFTSTGITSDYNVTADWFKGKINYSDVQNHPSMTSDNTSWNQTYADTLYAGIEWDYNQTQAVKMENIFDQDLNTTDYPNFSRLYLQDYAYFEEYDKPIIIDSSGLVPANTTISTRQLFANADLELPTTGGRMVVVSAANVWSAIQYFTASNSLEIADWIRHYGSFGNDKIGFPSTSNYEVWLGNVKYLNWNRNGGKSNFFYYAYGVDWDVGAGDFIIDGGGDLRLIDPSGNFENAGETNLNHTVTIEEFKGVYGGGSAYVCVYDNGTLFASDSACP